MKNIEKVYESIAKVYDMAVYIEKHPDNDNVNVLLQVTRGTPKVWNEGQVWTEPERLVRTRLYEILHKLPFTNENGIKVDRYSVDENHWGPDNIPVRQQYHAFTGAIPQETLDELAKQLEDGFNVKVIYNLPEGLGFTLPFAQRDVEYQTG